MNTLENILMMLIPALSGGVGGFFFGRGKYKAEVESIQANNDTEMIKNAQSIISIYKQELTDLQDRNNKKFTELNKTFEQKIKVLQEEIKIHKRINTNLKKENADMRRRLREFEKQQTI